MEGKCDYMGSEEDEMNLTVEDVAKRTGLSVSTVRQYAWRMKVGTKKGTRKFFSPEEAKKITSGRAGKPSKGSKKKVKKAGARSKSVKKGARRKK
jgi:hypothetical protein